MNNIVNQTVAFIGDEVFKTPDDSSDENLTNVVRTELQFVIEELYKEGKSVFLTAISPGFDMLAAEVIMESAEKFLSIELHAVIPYPGHELRYSDADQLRYKRIYEAATSHLHICDEYCEDADKRTTEYLVANSSEVVLFHREANSVIEELVGEKAVNMYEELNSYFATNSPVKTFLQDYPNVPSFRYGREGVVFEGHNQPFPISFEQIAKIVREGDTLHFFLLGGLEISASLTINDCRVPFDRYRGN